MSKQGKQQQGSRQQNSAGTDAPKAKLRLALFDHLPRKVVKSSNSVEEDRILHPAVIKIGGLFSRGTIFSDDDRVTSLLAAFHCIVKDYKTPANKVLREDLDLYIRKQVQFIVDCRPLSVGMGHLIKYLRYLVSHLPPEISESAAKSLLLEKLQNFLDERIVFSGDNIARFVTSTIRDDDVILTFGSSPLLRKALLAAAMTRKFRLVVVDTRPLNEGLRTLADLSNVVHCVYSPLSGAASAMTDVTRVILGASCFMSNGAMLAPAGTAMVAALAKSKQIPVIVASESYKFSEKVQLDSIVFNELGHTSEIAIMSPATDGEQAAAQQPVLVPTPQKLSVFRGMNLERSSVSSSSGAGARADPADEVGKGLVSIPTRANDFNGVEKCAESDLPFEVVNLRYDLTPINNISVVATESGLIPPTSIPVLIRELQADFGERR